MSVNFPVKTFTLLSLLIFIITINYDHFLSILSLNSRSIIIVKQTYHGNFESTSLISNFDDPTLNCHLNWLNTLNKYYINGVNQSLGDLKKALNCSIFYVKLVEKLAPTNIILSKEAAGLYPNEKLPLIWYGNNLLWEHPQDAEGVFISITSLWPTDSEAWRKLAISQELQGKKSESEKSYKISCAYETPHLIACANVGRLLEQAGRIDEAIYYYRLSEYKPAQEKADHLEAELIGGD